MADPQAGDGVGQPEIVDLRVLVVDTEVHGWPHAVEVLRSRGCECHVVDTDDNAVQESVDMRPDVIVLDSCVVEGVGPELLRRLKGDHRTALIPVICVASDSDSAPVLDLLAAGADDYVAVPYDPDELFARIVGAARRRALLGGVSPLTGLPGNLLLTREIQARLDAGSEFAFLHVDLDNFKAYNDRYGYVRGDRVIADTAHMLHAQIERLGALAVLGHIGGDDFGVVATVDAAKPLADAIAEAFDGLSPSFYEEAARARGAITVERRDGRQVDVPLMSVSVGVALWTARHPRATTAVADTAAEMKSVAKRHSGSFVAVDRRRP